MERNHGGNRSFILSPSSRHRVARSNIYEFVTKGVAHEPRQDFCCWSLILMGHSVECLLGSAEVPDQSQGSTILLRGTGFVPLFFPQRAQHISGSESGSCFYWTSGKITLKQFHGKGKVSAGTIQQRGRFHQNIGFGDRRLAEFDEGLLHFVEPLLAAEKLCKIEPRFRVTMAAGQCTGDTRVRRLRRLSSVRRCGRKPSVRVPGFTAAM